MWPTVLLLVTLVVVTHSEILPGVGFDREMSQGVKSLGFNVIYGDEDFTILNEVVTSEDKRQALKHKDRYKDTIKQLPAEDVKCLMSVDRYCTTEMGNIKSVLIQAVQEDCAKCTDNQKEKAGQVIASVMAHDPVAWKLFLTRAILLKKKNETAKVRKKRDKMKYKMVGVPEDVTLRSKYRFALPGVKVKIKRARMKKVS